MMVLPGAYYSGNWKPGVVSLLEKPFISKASQGLWGQRPHVQAENCKHVQKVKGRT